MKSFCLRVKKKKFFKAEPALIIYTNVQKTVENQLFVYFLFLSFFSRSSVACGRRSSLRKLKNKA